MNPRQRRGVLFILTSVAVTLAVVVAVTNYVADVNSRVGSLTTVYRASEPVAPYTPLSAENLEAVEVPARWTSPSTEVDLADLEGRRVGFALARGTRISEDMLIPPSELSSTEREIAINVGSVTGVAGRVQPGDFVDIYAAYADVEGVPPQVRVLVREVRVISLGGTRTVTEESAEGGLGQQEVIPVTLALEPNDALAVTFAAQFAAEVRLVGLPTDQGLDREGEQDVYDATDLGGEPVPEEETP